MSTKLNTLPPWNGADDYTMAPRDPRPTQDDQEPAEMSPPAQPVEPPAEPATAPQPSTPRLKIAASPWFGW
nr:hypothetical protein [Candidatus Sigynarchaeota archaeon]